MKRLVKSDFLQFLIEGGCELALAWFERGYMMHRGRTFKDLTYQQRTFVPAIRDLKRKRFIDVRYDEDGAVVSLTRRGMMFAVMDALGKDRHNLVDERFCYVVFDIPESHRSFRRLFTQLLKHAGFERVQKSVWRTRRDVVRGMKLLLKMNPGVEQYIRIIVGTE